MYCNGDSYSDETYQPDLLGRTYIHEIGRQLQGFTVSKARSGSNNRRILRVALHDLMQHRLQNPQQPTVAILGLSFESRDEIWLDAVKDLPEPEESNFFRYQMAHDVDWYEQLRRGEFLEHNRNRLQTQQLKELGHDISHFFDRYREGRVFFYSPYQERINLLMLLYLLTEWCRTKEINLLVFSSVRMQALDQEYLKDFFHDAIDDRYVMDLEKFSICDWCREQGFTPYPGEPIDIAHYGADAHQAFGVYLLDQLRKRNLLQGIAQ